MGFSEGRFWYDCVLRVGSCSTAVSNVWRSASSLDDNFWVSFGVEVDWRAGGAGIECLELSMEPWR